MNPLMLARARINHTISGGSESGYMVNDPGDSAFEGLYIENGMANGYPTYRLDDTHFMYTKLFIGTQTWALGTSVNGAFVYRGLAAWNHTPDTSIWSVGTGIAPAPTVTFVP